MKLFTISKPCQLNIYQLLQTVLPTALLKLKIVKLNSIPFETVSHEYLSNYSQSIACDSEQDENELTTREAQSEQVLKEPQAAYQVSPSGIVELNKANLVVNESDSSKPTQLGLTPNIPRSIITHPDVQKVVVEHIV